jgi:dihydroorotate dehydrogenase electron transfer subunit
MKAIQVKAKIISNQKFSGNYWHLEFESALIAKQAIAGQFVNIRVSENLAPLLRRPVSIHGVKGKKVKLIYKILGSGTQILATRKAEDSLDVLGPLGNGFNYRSLAKSPLVKNILIAGGIGVAPLVFLAEKLKKTKPLVLIGARSKVDILCIREFKSLGCELKLATLDGSVGFKGQVTDLFKIILEQTKSAQVFSCGPELMLKTVASLASKYKIEAQLSLEAHMACGIGACLGCVVATKTGYKTVCKDGPVFSSEELAW